jgi:hypothetical protein
VDVTLLDIGRKVLQDFSRNMGHEGAWKQGFDETTRISQEASQIQGPSGARQDVDGR